MHSDGNGMRGRVLARCGMDKAGDGLMDNWSLDTTKRSCYICLNPLLLIGQIEGGRHTSEAEASQSHVRAAYTHGIRTMTGRR